MNNNMNKIMQLKDDQDIKLTFTVFELDREFINVCKAADVKKVINFIHQDKDLTEADYLMFIENSDAIYMNDFFDTVDIECITAAEAETLNKYCLDNTFDFITLSSVNDYYQFENEMNI